MRVLNLLLNGPVFGVIMLFLAVVWMLRNQKDKTRPILVFALVLNLFFGFLLNTLMGREGSSFPLKFDHILYNMDASLGISAASIARPLQGILRAPLVYVYQAMIPMMIAWFLVTQYSRIRASVVLAYVAEMVIGPLLYAILPACGPIYAFGSQWLHPPAVSAQAIRLSGLPNAFPSLHVGTAFVFLLLAPGRIWKIVALLFFAATCLAILATGEHYVIDVIPGLAFGAFAAAIGLRKYRRAAAYLALTLAWCLSVRFASSYLIALPIVTRIFAAATVALACFALWMSWTDLAAPADTVLDPASTSREPAPSTTA
jgi:hypothetical protein